MGAREVEELAVELGGRVLACHLIDFGELGLLGAQRATVLHELGLSPAPFAAPVPQRDAFPVADAARRAVRDYQRPDRLLANPLGDGGPPEERVESVRRFVREALDAAFGDSEAEQRLREALHRAYVEPSSSHDRAALDLHVSRTTYFRWLRTGLARVGEYAERRFSP
jgi:hypothetical protein